jgi:hypothetical protein
MQLQSPLGAPSLCELSAQGLRRDEVRERALAVDLHHRQPLPIAGLELGIARDVDLPELEWLLGPDRLEHAARRVAQVALRSVIENDSDYGYRPRVIVASETRWTARP